MYTSHALVACFNIASVLLMAVLSDVFKLLVNGSMVEVVWSVCYSFYIRIRIHILEKSNNSFSSSSYLRTTILKGFLTIGSCPQWNSEIYQYISKFSIVQKPLHCFCTAASTKVCPHL